MWLKSKQRCSHQSGQYPWLWNSRLTWRLAQKLDVGLHSLSGYLGIVYVLGERFHFILQTPLRKPGLESKVDQRLYETEARELSPKGEKSFKHVPFFSNRFICFWFLDFPAWYFVWMCVRYMHMCVSWVYGCCCAQTWKGCPVSRLIIAYLILSRQSLTGSGARPAARNPQRYCCLSSPPPQRWVRSAQWLCLLFIISTRCWRFISDPHSLASPTFAILETLCLCLLLLLPHTHYHCRSWV